jgi:CDP-diacylglycerol pyrophosphatase
MSANITNRLVRRVAATAAMIVVPALAIGLSPIANATTPAPFDACDTTPSSTNLIWDGVNPATHTPNNPGKGNAAVVWPNGDTSRGYAIKYGASSTNTHDLLVVPTVRELGIECRNLRGDAPEYFNDGYNERTRMTGNDWVLGINSVPGRHVDQLHIHLTQLDPNTRADIDKAYYAKPSKIAQSEKDWYDAVVPVRGQVASTKGAYTEREVRMWHVGSMKHNFFAKLNDFVVAKSKASMSDESMLITAAPHNDGFIVLVTDKVSGLKNGADNVETFMNKK